MAAPSITASLEDWQRVAQAVRDRRSELGERTVDDVIAASRRYTPKGVSRTVVSLVENARQLAYQQRTLRALSVGLDWPPQMIEWILATDDLGELRALRLLNDAGLAPPEDGSKRPSTWIADASAMLAELRQERGIDPGEIRGVSRSTVAAIERGAHRDLKPGAWNAYADAIGVIHEAIDWLGGGASIEEVMIEHQEPEVQIAALAGQLDDDAQTEVMSLIKKLLAASQQSGVPAE